MISLAEIRETPEFRKLFRLFAAAAILWLAFLLVVGRIHAQQGRLAGAISDGDQILNNASLYLSHPAAGQTVATTEREETLTVLSQIVDALELRERMRQLQSNASGVTLQLERLYGNEMSGFLSTLEKRGIRVKTAELRITPSDGERLLGCTLVLEQNR
jgi:hypothetical protein